MWLVIDTDSLEVVNIVKRKKEAVWYYSEEGKSRRISTGLYLVSDANSSNEYESYIVNKKAIPILVAQGFEWLDELIYP